MTVLVKILLRWFLLVPVRTLAPLLPAGAVHALGRAGGRIQYLLAGDARRRISERYRDLAGEDAPRDLGRVVLRSSQNFIMSELEVLLFRRMNPGNIDRYVSIEGKSNLDEGLAAGRGAILLHAHFGNAHMLMPALGHRGYAVNQIGLLPTDSLKVFEDVKLPRPDSLTRSWFRWKDKYEKALPVTFIHLGSSLRPAIDCLKKNEVLAVSLDGVEGNMISVPFLRKRASFMTGPIRLAMTTGAAIVPAFTIRNRNGTHRLVIEPPLGGCASVEEGVTYFKALLERYMKEYPCHYVRLLAFDTPPFQDGK